MIVTNKLEEATIRLIVRAKNHKLLSIRESMNYSQAEMAEYLNINIASYGNL